MSVHLSHPRPSLWLDESNTFHPLPSLITLDQKPKVAESVTTSASISNGTDANGVVDESSTLKEMAGDKSVDPTNLDGSSSLTTGSALNERNSFRVYSHLNPNRRDSIKVETELSEKSLESSSEIPILTQSSNPTSTPTIPTPNEPMANDMQFTSPSSARSTDSSGSDSIGSPSTSQSSSHYRRFSNGNSSINTATPTSVSSVPSHLRQMSTDSISSVSSNSISPPPLMAAAVIAGFSFNSPGAGATHTTNTVTPTLATVTKVDDSNAQIPPLLRNMLTTGVPVSVPSSQYGMVTQAAVVASIPALSSTSSNSSSPSRISMKSSQPRSGDDSLMLDDSLPSTSDVAIGKMSQQVGLIAKMNSNMPTMTGRSNSNTHTNNNGPAYGSSSSLHQPLQSNSNTNSSSSQRSTSSSHSSTPHHSPHVGPMNSNGLKRGQGFSCHHCKTHKLPDSLLFCSNQSKKGPGKKRCRKKFCESCLKRLYGHPADQPLSSVVGFQCPACLGNCVCAGCERKSAPNTNGTGSTSNHHNGTNITEGSDNTSSSGSMTSESSPAAVAVSLPLPLGASNSQSGPISATTSLPVTGLSPIISHCQLSNLKDRGQSKPTTPLGKPPGKKRRTSIDTSVDDTKLIDTEGKRENTNSSVATHATNLNTISSELPTAGLGAPLVSHIRRHSGDWHSAISNTFHLPPSSIAPLPFNIPSPHSTILSHRIGSTSNGTSPRLSATGFNTPPTSAASNRMIHIPAFSLHSPINILSNNTGSGIFASAVHPLVGGTTSTNTLNASTATSMDVAGSNDVNGPTAIIGNMSHDSTGSSTSTSVSSLSPSNSPFTASRSVAPVSSSSSFSPSHAVSSEVDGLSSRTLQNHTSAGGILHNGESHQSFSMFTPGSVSPNLSPSVMKRLILTPADQSQAIGASSALPTSLVTSMTNSVLNPSALTTPAGVGNASESEPMKVLANVACTVNSGSSALPPTHPPSVPCKADSSPKLAYIGSSLVSPTHLVTLPPPAMATLNPITSSPSLASISAMKAQHAMEVQCLLQQQQQQLAELELRAFKELESHHQHSQHSHSHTPPLHHLPWMPSPSRLPSPSSLLSSPSLKSQSRPASSTPIQHISNGSINLTASSTMAQPLGPILTNSITDTASALSTTTTTSMTNMNSTQSADTTLSSISSSLPVKGSLINFQSPDEDTHMTDSDGHHVGGVNSNSTSNTTSSPLR